MSHAIIRLMWGLKIFEGISIGLLSLASLAPRQGQEALTVTKEINKNTVHYEVIPNDDCTFNEKNPFNIYWTVFDEDKKEYKRESLNFIEKYVYGLEIQKNDGAVLVAELKALKKKDIRVPLTLKLKKVGNSCRIHRISELTRIHLQKFLNSKPTQALLYSGNDRVKVSLE